MLLEREMDPIQRYYNLIRRTDGEARRLTLLHGDAISCRPGCTACCANLTVFPVEFHAIHLAMTRAGIKLDVDAFDSSAACGFLLGDRCRIYPFRPIICRTHGLPILYLSEPSDGPVWEVSFCELNFAGSEHLEFTDDTLLNIEQVNEELSRINRDFLTLASGNGTEPPLRIPLKKLCGDRKSEVPRYQYDTDPTR